MDEFDFATLEEMVHPDLMSDSPQSGERTRGFDAFRAQMEQYPGGGAQNPLQSIESRLLEEENRWAITPSYTVIPLSGKKEFTVLFRVQYPDGRWWRMI